MSDVAQVSPGSTSTVYLDGPAPTGLVGTLTFRLIDSKTDDVIIAESTAGITESIEVPGRYRRSVTWPTVKGDYQAVWRNGLVQVTEDFEVSYSVDYRPTLEEVAKHVHRRVVDGGGHDLPVWTDDTDPTAAQIEEIIDSAVRDVRRDLGPILRGVASGSVSEDVIGAAQDLAAVRAAMEAEATFYPEQTSGSQDTFPLLKTLYTDGVQALERTTTPGAGVRLA